MSYDWSTQALTVMRLTKSQEKYTNQIFDYFCQIIDSSRTQRQQQKDFGWFKNPFHIDNEKKTVYFEAPTGSGKTFMIFNLINWIFKKLGKKTIIVFLTISDTELPAQIEDKFNRYSVFNVANFDIKHIQAWSKSKTYAVKDYVNEIHFNYPGVLIFGQACLNKSSLLMKQGGFEKFLAEIQSQELDLIYIRDEAHRGARVREDIIAQQAQSKLMNNATFVLKMTATLKKEQLNTNAYLVRMHEWDVNTDNEYLIKDQIQTQFDDRLSSKDSNIIDWKEYFELCIKQFQKVRQEYQCEISTRNINPAMLIQVSSRLKKNSVKFNRDLNIIRERLLHHKLNWATWFGDDKSHSLSNEVKVTLSELSYNDSPFDVIIIKIGPGTGWDIPRACMLVQLRNITSEILNRQTIGRIRRNPIANLRKNATIAKYYVYSNSTPSDKYAVYRLKEKFKDESYYLGLINRTIPTFNLKSKSLETLDEEKEYKIKFHRLWQEKTAAFTDFKTKVFQNKNLCPASGQRKYLSGDRVVFEEITNLLELTTWLKEEKKKYQKYLVPITGMIESWNLTHENLVWYFIINDLMDDLKKIYQHLFKQQRPIFKLQLHRLSLPTEHVIWNCKDKFGFNFSNQALKNHFAYDLIGACGIEKFDFYFDSKIEREYFVQLDQKLHTTDGLDHFFKNPVVGNSVSLEYLEFDDGQNWLSERKHKHYPDVILKFEDNLFCYVEIKSVNDVAHNNRAFKYKRHLIHDYVRKFAILKSIFKYYKTDNEDLCNRIDLVLEQNDHFSSITKILKTLHRVS